MEQDLYSLIQTEETADLLRRAVPYAYDTPTTDLCHDCERERVNILWFSDSHIDCRRGKESLDNVRDTIAFANRCPIHLDAVLFGGDFFTPTGRQTKEAVKAKAAPFFAELKKCKIPLILTKGNHDLNDWNNLPENAFTKEDFNEMWYDFARETYGIRQGCDNSPWGYYDIEGKKIRVVFLDCQDVDKKATNEEGNVLYYGGKAWGFSEAQLVWLYETALNFDDKEEKDWGVIILLHQGLRYSPRVAPAYENSMEKALAVCKAFQTQGTYDHVYTFPENPFYNLNLHADFSRYAGLAQKPHLIGWFMGHEHHDRTEKADGINMVWTLNNSATNAYSDARVVRMVGTSTQNAFDIINIDTTRRKIRFFRYGAGKNCFGQGGDRFVEDGLDY